MVDSPPDTPTKRRNPYVGPRAYVDGELLPARDREIREVSDLIVAQRMVLLHAPSGAGKTSLLNAGVIPLLRTRRLDPTAPLRVNAPPPSGGVRNRYTYSVALDLLGDDHAAADLASLPMTDVVKLAAERTDDFLLLVFDQVEELMIIDPSDHKHQIQFFSELGEALSDGRVWALFAIREDYIGGLDRFRPYVPGRLEPRYRLDYLGLDAARVAIQKPAKEQDVDFTDKAAQRLVEQLATATKITPGGGEEEVPAPYVQPVELQVVCRKLWRAVAKEHPAGFRRIGPKDVKNHVDISVAMSSYYRDIVHYVATKTGADEMVIRAWFENDLITPQGYRSQTLYGPQTGADPASVLDGLRDGYLIRADERGGSTWYELAHDKLVRPVLTDNERWMQPYLEPWQLAARQWHKTHDPEALLGPADLRKLKSRDRAQMSAAERDFLTASQDRVGEIGGVLGGRELMSAFAVIEAIVIVLLLVVLLG